MNAANTSISHLLSHQPVRIVRSASVEQKQRIIREITLKCKGRHESVLELGGTVIGSDIFVTDCLIPRATIGFAHFKVKDRALSTCWSEAEKSRRTRHLQPVGDLHYHPETGHSLGENYDGPSPSSVDQANSLRQASLYFPFNLQTSESETVISPDAEGAGDGFARYRIDRLRSIRLPALEAGGGGFEIVFKEKQSRSLWGSLIYPSNARSDAVSASAIVHAFCPCDPDQLQVFRCEDVETVVLPDEAVARMTGWPMDKIRLHIDPAALEEEVCDKYRVKEDHRYETGWYHYGWGAADGYHRDAYLPVCRQDAWHASHWNGAFLPGEDIANGLWEVVGVLKRVSWILEEHPDVHSNGQFNNFTQRREAAVRLLRWCVQSLERPD